MNFFFHPEAEEEFLLAIDYYESCQPELGQEFAIEVRRAIQRALDFPFGWTAIGGDIRRCLLNRFPYGILYSVESDRLYIVAVMHLHREPGYWKKRV